MLTQKQAVETATKQLGWTGADAKRALAGQKFPIETNDLFKILCQYAGPELFERQKLQAAQKTQVTKKKNYIEKIELTHAETIKEFETNLEIERSHFISIIAKVYQVAQKFGMKDLWVETLLSQYNQYYQTPSPNSYVSDSSDTAA